MNKFAGFTDSCHWAVAREYPPSYHWCDVTFVLVCVCVCVCVAITAVCLLCWILVIHEEDCGPRAPTLSSFPHSYYTDTEEECMCLCVCVCACMRALGVGMPIHTHSSLHAQGLQTASFGRNVFSIWRFNAIKVIFPVLKLVSPTKVRTFWCSQPHR